MTMDARNKGFKTASVAALIRSSKLSRTFMPFVSSVLASGS